MSLEVTPFKCRLSCRVYYYNVSAYDIAGMDAYTNCFDRLVAMFSLYIVRRCYQFTVHVLFM